MKQGCRDAEAFEDRRLACVAPNLLAYSHDVAQMRIALEQCYHNERIVPLTEPDAH